MSYCSVKCCGKNSKTSGCAKDGVSFHKFPDIPEIKEKWIEATQKENWLPTKSSVMCSRHFTPDSFVSSQYNKRRRLLSSALPTQFLPIMTPEWNDNADPQNLQQEIILPSTTVTQLDSDIIAPSIGQIQSNNHTYYALITNDQANMLNVPATGQTVCSTEPTSSQAYQIKTDVDKPETGEQSSSISQYEVKEETNSFDDFAEYVREQLKILSEEDALSAQEEIKNVLERYKIKQEPKDPLPEYENKLFVFKCEPESEEDEKMDVK